MINAGGFGSLSLSSGDYMQFAGNVSLALRQSITLTAAAFTSGPAMQGAPGPSAPVPVGNVSLSAPYTIAARTAGSHSRWQQQRQHPQSAAAVIPTAATFEADASQIDVRGLILVSAAARERRVCTPASPTSNW